MSALSVPTHSSLSGDECDSIFRSVKVAQNDTYKCLMFIQFSTRQILGILLCILTNKIRDLSTQKHNIWCTYKYR